MRRLHFTSVPVIFLRTSNALASFARVEGWRRTSQRPFLSGCLGLGMFLVPCLLSIFFLRACFGRGRVKRKTLSDGQTISQSKPAADFMTYQRNRGRSEGAGICQISSSEKSPKQSGKLPSEHESIENSTVSVVWERRTPRHP
jgi:hypothetical protein